MELEILLNGQPYQLSSPTTVAELLSDLGFQGKRIAVEINEEIIPRSEHLTTQLRAADQVEIVQAIGGG